MRAVLGVLLIFGIVVLPITAHAQCAPRKVVVKQLKDKFQESSGGMGLARGFLYEIWSAPKTGTFTILMTSPKNVSCVMASGRDWSFRNPDKTYW